MGMRKFGSAALPFNKVAYVVKGFPFSYKIALYSASQMPLECPIIRN